MHEYLLAWRLFAVFDGRATRREYWRFTMVSMAVGIICYLLDFATGFTMPDVLPTVWGVIYELFGVEDQLASILESAVPGAADIPFDSSGESGLFWTLYDWVSAVPVYAITARRLHDIGKSGWWSVLNCIPFLGGLLLLIWMLEPDNLDANRYSENLSGRYFI